MSKVAWVCFLSGFLYLSSWICATGNAEIPLVGTMAPPLQSVQTEKAALPAFPGAEGFGSTTRGGRGGRVIEVTTIQAEGPGSFREACETAGPRIIVFRVGGTILLDKNIEITEPYLTIAGQTAPGDGICLRGASLLVATHDVIIRGLRIRVGDDPKGPNPDERDGLRIGALSGPEMLAMQNECFPADATAPRKDVPNIICNVIIDHCSVSWGIDENMDITFPAHDITVQWCVNSEALSWSIHSKREHSKAFLIHDHCKRVTVHHNLFVHNKDRHPMLKGDTEGEVINNVVWNYLFKATLLSDSENSGPYRANVIGNYYIKGPRVYQDPAEVMLLSPKKGSLVYVKGNIGAGRPDDTMDEWAVVNESREFQSREFAVSPSGVTAQPAAEARDLVLKFAGATVPRRDAVDERIVKCVGDRSGTFINSQNQVGGWPEMKGGPAPDDADHDGMPDEWEKARGLNPADPADGSALTASGYSMVEEYINSLIPMPAAE